jgi:hypothetical protein
VACSLHPSSPSCLHLWGMGSGKGTWGSFSKEAQLGRAFWKGWRPSTAFMCCFPPSPSILGHDLQSPYLPGALWPFPPSLTGLQDKTGCPVTFEFQVSNEKEYIPCIAQDVLTLKLICSLSDIQTKPGVLYFCSLNVVTWPTENWSTIGQGPGR